MSYQFTILHLSDLHERGEREKEAARRYRVLGPVWREQLQELRREGAIDLVCFTGDLADWGLVAEYQAAEARLDELLSLADRIVVMSEGRIVFECPAAEADRRLLGAHMGGHGAHAAAA